MLIIVSPAKKLNMNPIHNIKLSKPFFKKNVEELVETARNLSVEDLKKLMDLSPKLAQLNKERFSNFGNQEKKAAVFLLLETLTKV